MFTHRAYPKGDIRHKATKQLLGHGELTLNYFHSGTLVMSYYDYARTEKRTFIGIDIHAINPTRTQKRELIAKLLEMAAIGDTNVKD
jgi:hypothetical protein